MMLKNTPKGIGGHMGRYHKDVVQANKKVIEFTLRCKECNQLVANSNNVLGRHVRKEHGLEYPDYLVKHEHNGVWPTCACGCGEKVKWHMGGFSRFVSKACGSTGENNGMFGKKGVDSPNFGKERSIEARLNYSRAAKKRWSDPDDKRHAIMQSDEYRQKQSDANKLSYATTDRAQQVSEGCKRWWREHPEFREEKRQLAIRLLEAGLIGPQAPFKTEWMHNPFTGQDEYMHSSWETAFLQKCIEQDFPVTKKHDIRIPYVDPNGIERTYVPDFMGLKCPILFEVKGHRDDTVNAKEAACLQWCEANCYELVMVEEKIV